MLGVTPCEYADEHTPPKTRHSEDGIILRSFVLTQYWRVTDGRTDTTAIANTARSSAACRNE